MAERHVDEEEYMTTSEAARYLALSEGMVRKLNNVGELPALVSSLRGYRMFQKAVLDRFKAERARNPKRAGRPRKNRTEEATKEK